MVAIGDSSPAGMQHGTLIETLQPEAFPVLLYKQVASALSNSAQPISKFPMPLISSFGLPLSEFDLSNPPTWPRPASQTPGRKVNEDENFQPYDLAVPEFNLAEVLDRTLAGNYSLEVADQLAPQILTGRIFSDLSRQQSGIPRERVYAPPILQAIRCRPSLLVVWAGTNDYIEPLFYPERVGASMTSTDLFRTGLRTLFGRLATSESRAQVAIATLPDITKAPLLRPLGQPFGAIPDDSGRRARLPFRIDLSRVVEVPSRFHPLLRRMSGGAETIIESMVLPLGVTRLNASGNRAETGLEATEGSSVPMPIFFANLKQLLGKTIEFGEIDFDLSQKSHFTSKEILSRSEKAIITDRIRAFNRIINEETRPGDVIVPIGQLFDGLPPESRAYGGDETFFSLDGLHPNSIGHRAIAVQFIRAMNRRLAMRAFGGVPANTLIVDPD